MFAATNTVANHSPNSLAATNAVAIRLNPFWRPTFSQRSLFGNNRGLIRSTLTCEPQISPSVFIPSARLTASLHRLAFRQWQPSRIKSNSIIITVVDGLPTQVSFPPGFKSTCQASIASHSKHKHDVASYKVTAIHCAHIKLRQRRSHASVPGLAFDHKLRHC